MYVINNIIKYNDNKIFIMYISIIKYIKNILYIYIYIYIYITQTIYRGTDQFDDVMSSFRGHSDQCTSMLFAG